MVSSLGLAFGRRATVADVRRLWADGWPSQLTRRMDLERKKALCAESGVAHYWVVDPLDAPRGTVTVHRLGASGYGVVAEASGTDELVVDEPHPIRVTPDQLLPRW